jgi:hypothetical protein
MAPWLRYQLGDFPSMKQCDDVIRLAEERAHRGLAPPPDIYRIELRRRVDWSRFPAWARPVDPEVFKGCCHEG